jgi:hypothetical protein
MNRINKIYFENLTNLPVMIDYWEDHPTLDGLTQLKSTRIGSGERKILTNYCNEWMINSMFPDKEDKDLWKNDGLSDIIHIGTFRSSPNIHGEYSVIHANDLFRCIYSNIKNIEEGVNGKITLKRF